MHHYVISLGSNLGDKAAYLAAARAGLAELGTIEQVSDIIETEPFGVADELFLNQVLTYRTTLVPTALIDTIKQLEHSLGRQKRDRWDNREIDIDILLWDGDDIDTVSAQGYSIIIPHPGIGERPFVQELIAQLPK